MGEERPTDRRGFLRANAGALGRLLAEAMGQAVVKAQGGQRYLRPPGAIDEAGFLLACTRCDECLKACPVGAIKRLPSSAGVAVGTPFVDPQDVACTLCGDCMPVCQPQALLTVAEPRQVRMGRAVIDTDHCWAHQGSICDICYQRCPFPDEAIRMAAGKPEVLAACTGCGLCAQACVSTPPAITITPCN